MSGYVYIESEPHLWTVGFYDGNNEWQSESDHESPEAAAERARVLNGRPPINEGISPEAVKKMYASLQAIALIAGNLPNDRLTGPTGPNDAAHRGSMLVNAREIAREALAFAKGATK